MIGQVREAGRTPDPAGDPRQDAAVKARLKWILAGIVLLCLVLGAAGWAFVSWLATLPPGTLKHP